MKHGGPFAQVLIGDNLGLYYAYVGDVDNALRWTQLPGTLTTADGTSLFIAAQCSNTFDKMRGSCGASRPSIAPSCVARIHHS
jgi:hypothetical protein